LEEITCQTSQYVEQTTCRSQLIIGAVQDLYAFRPLFTGDII